MYYAWKLHNILPSVYFNCGCGEKKILSTFLEKEIEENNENQEE